MMDHDAEMAHEANQQELVNGIVSALHGHVNGDYVAVFGKLAAALLAQITEPSSQDIEPMLNYINRKVSGFNRLTTKAPSAAEQQYLLLRVCQSVFAAVAVDVTRKHNLARLTQAGG